MLLHRIKTEALDVDIEQVLGYGCWCNFQTNVRGKGAPLDDFDKICHKWAQERVGHNVQIFTKFSFSIVVNQKLQLEKCTKCIEMDGFCRDDFEPNTGDYNIKITKYDNSFTCNMNEDKCTRSQCQCDR